MPVPPRLQPVTCHCATCAVWPYACAACAGESNTAYYSRINAETAATIRAAKSDAVLMVNMCGHFHPAQSVPPGERKHLVSLSRQLDFLIDPGHYEGEATGEVLPPLPLGRMGKRLEEIARMQPQHRPVDLYAALAEVSR